MITWALIPVKRFNLGKSRLHEVLSASELEAVNRRLFQRTLSTVKESGIFMQIMVISEDEEALHWASEQGFLALCEEPTGDLNSALRQALAVIQENGTGSVLVIPTDLPMLTAEDLCLLADFAPEANGILVVPDHHMTGTNALYLSNLICCLPLLGRILARCTARLRKNEKLDHVIYLNSHIQHDLDTPEDLTYLRNSLK